MLDWGARRKILFDICGNLSDADVIASNPELADLPAMPGNNTVDDFKKIVAAAMKRANGLLNDIPGRIDEATRAIPETSGTTEKVNDAIAALNLKKAAAEQKRADITGGGLHGSTLRKSVSEKEALITEVRSRHLRRNGEVTEAIYAKLADARNKCSNHEASVISTKRAVEKAEAELKDLLAKRDRIKADYAAVQRETFDEHLTVCPTCGREYPQDDIARLKSDYNVHKSERLTAILESGKRTASKEMVAAKEREIETAKAEQEQASKLLEAAKAEIAALNEEIKAKTGTLQDFEHAPECAALKDELDTLRAQAADDTQAQSAEIAVIDAEIAEINGDIKRQFELLAAHTTAAAQNKRIAELRQQEEQLGDEYAAQERRLYLCDLFIKSKVALLDERINGKFKKVRFQLFQEQVNGGLKDCCDALVLTDEGNLVAWNNGANTAAKVNAGFEIIATLAEHWGIDVPVWFDGRESVTKLLVIPQQVISFAVREGETKLRLERE
jgi:DNA repair exonuclease SbcCD ATPase subunit